MKEGEALPREMTVKYLTAAFGHRFAVEPGDHLDWQTVIGGEWAMTPR